MARGCSVWILIILVVAGLERPVTRADDRQPIFRRRHVWGQFQPGSWKLVRVRTDTLAADGTVVTTSVNETRTTLEEINDEQVRLKVQASVELAGKKLEAAPQEVTQGLQGEAAGRAAVTQLGTEDVQIGGRAVPCRVEVTETAGRGTKTVTKTWISDDVAPYVLKREAVTTQVEGGAKLDETTTEVVQFRVRRPILQRIRHVFEVHMVHKSTKGKTITSSWICDEVPGGVVAQSSQEYDAGEQLIRRSTLELVSFEVK